MVWRQAAVTPSLTHWSCRSIVLNHRYVSQIARFMGPIWGPPGSCRPQMGPMLAPWTLLSGMSLLWFADTGLFVYSRSFITWISFDCKESQRGKAAVADNPLPPTQIWGIQNISGGAVPLNRGISRLQCQVHWTTVIYKRYNGNHGRNIVNDNKPSLVKGLSERITFDIW